MKITISMIALLALMAVPAVAQTWSNTLYGQEGTASDGFAGIDASGTGPGGSPSVPADNLTNWNSQGGSGSWSGIYSWDTDAWQEEASSGDASILVECDIEMYWSETTANNEIYFHLGNPFTATTSDKTAVVDGTYATNHPMYIGISFDNTSKDVSDFVIATGTVLNGMVGSVDIGGRDISAESFDIQFMARLNSGAWLFPTSFGAGSHGTQQSVLWWSPTVTGMGTALGSGTMDWLVRILPTAAQPDGNYHLDPVIVSAPVL
ncbi:MAG: hypothetical protein GWP08_14350 [Nitrospiraceae bacterium]|nr:hypothetical protein [Nitrospiraceae bacterium]